MKDFIEALQIFDKYTDKEEVFHCEHDVLYVNIDISDVSSEDRVRLAELGFLPDEDDLGCFISFRYGSC